MDIEIPAQLVNMKRTITQPGRGGTPAGWMDEVTGSSHGLRHLFRVEYHPFTGQYEAKVIDQYSGHIRRGEVALSKDEGVVREWLLQKWHEMKCLS